LISEAVELVFITDSAEPPLDTLTVLIAPPVLL